MLLREVSNRKEAMMFTRQLGKLSLLVVVALGVAIAVGSIGAGVGAARNIFTMSNTQEFGTIDPARGTDYTESYGMGQLLLMGSRIPLS